MLSLDPRDCQLGDKHSGDCEETEDGQKIRTLTFELTGVMLEKRELNALLGEPLAWDVLFNAGTEPPEPLLRSLKELELKACIEGAWVALTYGLNAHRMQFVDCKLSKIKLALQVGGLTALSCKVTTTPALDDSLSELIEQFGNAAECEIRAQLPSAQQDLPLNKFGEGEQPAAH